jgi:hypothetical protein
MGMRITLQIGQKDLLSSWADWDHFVGTVLPVLGLVSPRTVIPHIAITVEVAGPHIADFTRPRSSESLDADHIGDDFGEMGKRLFDQFIGHWLYWGQLGGSRAASLQRLNCGKSMRGASRNKLLGLRPFEESLHGLDDRIAAPAGSPLLHQELSHLLQFARSESRCWKVIVRSKGHHCLLHVPPGRRRLAGSIAMVDL